MTLLKPSVYDPVKELGQKLTEEMKLIKGMSTQIVVDIGEMVDILMLGKVSFQNEGVDESETGDEDDENKSRCYVKMKAYLKKLDGKDAGQPSGSHCVNFNRDRHYEVFPVAEVFEGVGPGIYELRFEAMTHSLAHGFTPPVYVKGPTYNGVTVLEYKK